ncbi:MAG: undecaprenyl-diphosphatase, partial [Alphaproteobacteria bacterium]|nr:undecaprenyl-diphosphatase [Alphaproteobacteria bacterium]
KLASFIADDFILLIPALFVTLWLWGDDAKRNHTLKAVSVVALSLGVNQLIGLVWQHPRPSMIGLGHTWIAHAADSSFPSDHMTVFAGIAVTLLLDGMAGLGLTTLVLGLGVAWARVFLGVHFPLDMVGAIIVALIAYALVHPLWQRVGSTITDLALRSYRLILSRPIAAGWVRR